jgi:hypothetical protein
LKDSGLQINNPMKKNHQLLLAISALLLFVFFIYYQSNKTSRISSTTTKTNIKNVNQPTFKYSIIKTEEQLDQKFSIDIRLEKEYYKSDLARFAYFIKEEYLNKPYDYIFISYYLPGMKPGEGAWATSHFNPDLDIFLTSPFYDDSRKVINIDNKRIKSDVEVFEGIAKPSKIVGVWIQSENYLTFIFEKNGVPYLNEFEVVTKKPSKHYELITKTKNGKTVYIIEELLNYKPISGVKLIGEYTDYYTIESNGDLALYDDKGIIESYKRAEY